MFPLDDVELKEELQEFHQAVLDPSKAGPEGYFFSPSLEGHLCTARVEEDGGWISLHLEDSELLSVSIPGNQKEREQTARDLSLKVIRLVKAIREVLEKPYSEEELALYLFEEKSNG